MPKYTTQNQAYQLTATECDLPATIEKSRTAARIIAWARRHHVHWKAPYEDIARRYMVLLDSPRSEQGYINAAIRAYDEDSVDDVTVRFITAFRITGRDVHDLTASESYPDTAWQILSDATAPITWPPQKSTSGANWKVEDCCRIINTALEASSLEISASLAAMLYVTLLSENLGLKPTAFNNLEVLAYTGTSNAELLELGIALNRVGIIVERAVSYWLQREFTPTLNPGDRPLAGLLGNNPGYTSVSIVSSQSALLAEAANVRDKHKCVLSGRTSGLKVYHIIAHSIGERISDTHKVEFWQFLEIFMGKELMLKIRAYLIGDSETGSLINCLENCVCLSPEVYALLNDGCFILEPLEADGCSPMLVDASKFGESAIPAEYFVRYTQLAGLIQPLVQRGSGISRLSVHDIPAYTLEDDPILSSNPIYHVVQKRVLQNGEIIRFQTDNPDTHPLPHPHLFWLHAIIGRIVRMVGRSGEHEYATEFDDEVGTG
ncbi:hypothetical protein TWF281_000418 [Arthrobotrys megalospora]